MPTLSTCYLSFPNGLHIGTSGVNPEENAQTIPSDTLFAALIDAFRRDGGDPDTFIAPFPRQEIGGTQLKGTPPFQITSAFPFVGKIRFFPLPVSPQVLFDTQTLREHRKKIQQARFISESLFRKVLEGQLIHEDAFPAEDAAPGALIALQGGMFLLTANEIPALPSAFRHSAKRPQAFHRLRVYNAGSIPRVTVDRISAASEIFHTGRTIFAPECGLWLGINWQAPEAISGPRNHTYRESFERALQILADDGIGGKRTAGYGTFKWTNGESLMLPDSVTNHPVILLSRYHPIPEEIAALKAEKAAYTLIPVGGWLRSWDSTAQRRKRLWLLTEGSLIHPVTPSPWGNVVDVRPTYENKAGDLPHPVWRYGLALAVGRKEQSHV